MSLGMYVFSKFYRRHYELISKFNVGLKSILYQGLSEPEFYGDLVYKFKTIMGRTDVSDQFRKIMIRHKRIGYDLNVIRQSAYLVANPITVNFFAALLNCTPVDRVSDSFMAPTLSYSFKLVGTGACVYCLVHRGSTDDLLLLQISSGVVWQTRDLHLSHSMLYLLSPRLGFFIVLTRDLFVYRDDSLTS